MPWQGREPPRRVLAIRLQALGDVVATLPYLEDLRRKLRGGQIDLLTRGEYAEIPSSLELFDRIFALRGGRNRYLQAGSALSLVPFLRRRDYDLVIDLQNNRISRLIRSGLRNPAWSEFDVHAPLPHGERVSHAIDAGWPVESSMNTQYRFRDPNLGLELIGERLRQSEIVVLNPAGYFRTRNWPLENYADFAQLWLERRNSDAHFLLLGIPRLAPIATNLEQMLPGLLTNLVGKTTAAEAFNIIRHADFVLSEDSGLLHMAWTSGRPNVALFGSSRSQWSRPLGERSAWLDSDDLACGACMQPECRYGDVRCLTRYSPEEVFELALGIVGTATSSADGRLRSSDQSCSARKSAR